MSDNVPRKISYLWHANASPENAERVLAVKPAPILDNEGNVKQLIFAVDDVTEVTLLNRKAEEQSRNAAIFQAFLENDPSDLERFFKQSEEMLSSIRTLTEMSSRASVGEVLQLLHTLKGNARLFRFKDLSGDIHAIESAILELLKATESLSEGEDFKAEIKAQIGGLEASWARYRRVADTVLAREKSGLGEVLSIPKPSLQKLQAAVDEALIDLKDGDKAKVLKRSMDHIFDIPVKAALSKYGSMVEDIAVRLNKMIIFEIDGEDVFIDKNILASVEESLIHIIRNSIDHGIEAPEERKARGKAEAGRIQISCRQDATSVHLSIIDDGKGLDPHIIAKAGVRKGLITEIESQTMSDAEKINLIYRPNFSSKSEATEISGRGIGMEIVKKSIEKVGGALELQSTPGQGTQFDITIQLRE